MKTLNTFPSPTELKYFLEVAHSLNFSRASERLGISQPSLSAAMNRLEEQVGASLFSRHKNGVALTQAGKQLLSHAKQLLQYWEDIKAKALASHHEVQGKFTLGCHSTMVNHILAGFLPDLLEKNPKLELELKFDIPRNITEEVINLSLDIGIVVNPLKHPDLIIQKLCDDTVGFWTGLGKRKIQNNHSGEAILLCDPHLTQTQSLLKTLKKKGMTYQRIIPMNSLDAIANLAANNCGIGILPSRVAKSLYPKELKHVPNTPSYKDEICLVYRAENRGIFAIQSIINAAKDYFKKSKTH